MNKFDPFEQVMRDAEERVLQAGISGGDDHEQVDQATIMMATMSWSVRKIQDSNKALVDKIVKEEQSTRERLKRSGPAAGFGALVVGAVAFIRDWLS